MWYPKTIVSLFSQVLSQCKAAHTASAIKGASNMFNEVTDILSRLNKITNYHHFYHSCWHHHHHQKTNLLSSMKMSSIARNPLWIFTLQETIFVSFQNGLGKNCNDDLKERQANLIQAMRSLLKRWWAREESLAASPPRWSPSSIITIITIISHHHHYL